MGATKQNGFHGQEMDKLNFRKKASNRPGEHLAPFIDRGGGTDSAAEGVFVVNDLEPPLTVNDR